MKKKAVFERATNAKFFSVQVDRTYLRFKNNRAEIFLEEGEYYVSWVVRGKAGSFYELKMMEPHGELLARYTLVGNKDAGIEKIKI